MRCPICQKSETKVVDSRMATGGKSVRRRRECAACSFRFSTLEQTELLNVTVVKKDGRREPYKREKLETGVRKALEKRPIPEERVRELLIDIESVLMTKDAPEVATQEIGESVMGRLRELDEVAYIRFASVYKSFRDVETFEQELQRLGKTSRRTRTRRTKR